MRMRALQIIGLILLIAQPIFSQQPTWRSLPDMPRARFGHCAVLFQERIWLIGGKNQFANSISEVDCYNLKTGQWESEVSKLHHARYNAAATVYQDKIFVIGGQNERQMLSSVEYYDSEDKKWKEWTPLPFPREGANALVFDSLLYVIGGIRSKGFFPTPTDIIEYWDEKSKSWQESSTWRLQQPRALMQSVVVDSFVYILGGRFIDGQYNLVERFGSETGPESLHPFTIPRFYFAAVAVEKLIYVLGGIRWGDFDAITDTIEYYATNSDKWYMLNVFMKQPRAGLSAVSYKNSIYLFGGIDLGLKVSSAAEVLSDIPPKLDTRISSVIEPDIAQVPSSHQLLRNYPNPFNSATTIDFVLTETNEPLQLVIFNLLGERVRTFWLNNVFPGIHHVVWDGRDDQGRNVESGIYLAQLRSDRQLGPILKLSYIK
ncbi:MAG: T9SS type A sorting domain-containing protein [candidate division KSB1 bacterium]|nr:T9SS type A sorting domain-containing protein [candidate division KSB1 bacterium]